MSDTLESLANTLADRRHGDPSVSYVASLHHKGLNKILEKVGEESTEMILAAKEFQYCTDGAHTEQDEARLRLDLVKETADLWFHTLVTLSHLDVSHTEVLDELQRRFAMSGLEEKASRKQH